MTAAYPVAYVVRGTADDGEPLYWSNRDGWGNIEPADVFTADETRALRLPDAGTWEPLP